MQKPARGPIIATDYWHRLEDGRIQCDVCPRFCALREGQRGLCFVRARQDDRIVLTTYGRSSGFCVDPIEKKPLNHFLPGTAVLSFGTEGCNLSCRFCQNWDISKSREIATLADEASPELIARAAKKLGCRSVAFTYNDPTIFLEYASDVAAACHELGIAAVAVTAGYICEKPRESFYRSIDAANVDLKAFTEKFYREITGAHLQPVLDTLVYLKKRHERLARDHQPRHPGAERLGQGDRRDDAVGRREPGPGRSDALHGLSSRLEDAGRRRRRRRRRSRAPGVSRSRPASGTPTRGTSTTSREAARFCHVCAAELDRPRRIRSDRVDTRERPVRLLRRAVPGPFRGAPRTVGSPPPPDPPEGLRGLAVVSQDVVPDRRGHDRPRRV